MITGFQGSISIKRYPNLAFSCVLVYWIQDKTRELGMLKTLRFEDEFVAFWGQEEGAEKRIAEAAVLEIFREGLVSSGKAAELLNMPRQDFLDLLASKRIPAGSHPIKDVDILQKMLAEDQLSEATHIVNFEPGAKIALKCKGATGCIQDMILTLPNFLIL